MIHCFRGQAVHLAPQLEYTLSLHISLAWHIQRQPSHSPGTACPLDLKMMEKRRYGTWKGR